MSVTAAADEKNTDELVYEMTAGVGSQEISYIDEAGDEVVLSVEYIQPFARIAQGTYKVSKTVKGSWTASYNVKINSKRTDHSGDKFEHQSIERKYSFRVH